MNCFNVTITIEDLICSSRCKDNETNTITIKNSNETIHLKENYILNIIRVENSFFTILIQNGVNTIIRNVYTNASIQLCLPCRCAKHILTIHGTINSNENS